MHLDSHDDPIYRRRARELAAAGRAANDGLPAEDLEQLRARVRELPDELRAVVELRYFAGTEVELRLRLVPR